MNTLPAITRFVAPIRGHAPMKGQAPMKLLTPLKWLSPIMLLAPTEGNIAPIELPAPARTNLTLKADEVAGADQR